MSFLSRPAAAAPAAGRAVARWYGPAAGCAGGMIARRAAAAPMHTSLPSCSCRGAFSFSAPLPLQTRRGASRTSRRSPTVRKAERQARQGDGGGAPRGPGPGSGPEGRSAHGFTPALFPDNIATLQPALEAAMESGAADMGLSVEECMAVLGSARNIIQNQINVNEASLLRDHSLTPYKLHATAVALLTGLGVAGTDRTSAVATALMHLAANVGDKGYGYVPSVLSIISLYAGGSDAARSESGRRFRTSTVFRNAEAQFLAYLDTVNRSPAPDAPKLGADELVDKANAFTLAGILAENDGDAARAVLWYEAARDAGSEIAALEEAEGRRPGPKPKPKDENDTTRPLRWDWERRCVESLGRLQAEEALASRSATKGRRLQEARAVLRVAAVELGSAQAAMLLATKYAPSTGEASEAEEKEVDLLLQRAALGLVDGALEAIAQREADKVQKLTDKNEAAWQTKLAEEWRRVADAAAALDRK